MQKAIVFPAPAAGTATFATVTEVLLSYRVQTSLKRIQEINGEDIHCHFSKEILAAPEICLPLLLSSSTEGVFDTNSPMPPLTAGILM